jgi:hypothetical protein
MLILVWCVWIRKVIRWSGERVVEISSWKEGGIEERREEIVKEETMIMTKNRLIIKKCT